MTHLSLGPMLKQKRPESLGPQRIDTGSEYIVMLQSVIVNLARSAVHVFCCRILVSVLDFGLWIVAFTWGLICNAELGKWPKQ